MGHHYLNQLFSPKSVAIFGVSARENAMGSLVLQNILSSAFNGEVFPINPKHEKVQGLHCYASLTAVNKPVELAIIATPANSAVDILRECGELGCRNVVILSAGFAESGGGTAGKRLEKTLLEVMNDYGIHLIGPNCLGIMRPSVGLNATFSRNQAKPGKVALVSQSSAMATAILDWSATRQVGFSTVATLGDTIGVNFGETLDYLTLDPKTSSILLYIESIQDARAFMSGLRSASRMKPVVVLKAGRYEDNTRTVTSHTGAMVGGNDAFDAAMDRAGVVRVDSISQLFSAAEILSSGIKVEGNRLMVMTNGSGPGVMAIDRAVEMGLSMAVLPAALETRLSEMLPAGWSKKNPADILGDATPERYEAALEICLENKEMDGILVMLTPQALTDPKGVAEAVVRVSKRSKKTILACWIGNEQVAEGREILSAAQIPNFQTPEAAVEAFSYLSSYRSNQKLLMQVPSSVAVVSKPPDVRGARLIIESVLSEGRKHLSTTESRAILAAFHIPSSQTVLTRSPTEALVAAESAGYPVVMKISSPDVLHKSDVNGVRLNINSAHTVRSVYQELRQATLDALPDANIDGVTVETMYRGHASRELIIGVVRDPVFGPVISFGAGGTATEVHRDRAVALPPLNSYMIGKTIGRTRVAKLLNSFRRLPAIDFESLKEVMLRVSELVCELPEVIEMEINPLMVNAEGAVAVDARISLAYPAGASGRYDHMAIHPYPHDLVKQQQLADGTDIMIRPIRPEDAEMQQSFMQNLSGESRYMRFMQALRELTPDMLARFTQIDYDRDMAFVVLAGKDEHEVEVGVSRYSVNPDQNSCEFALVIADDWQNRGLGGLLMQVLIDVARDKGLATIIGDVLAHNTGMLKLMNRLGFERHASEHDSSVVVVTKRLLAVH
uniref:Acetyl-CoA synthetase (ADP-forming) alpha and beta chains, putative n=1 Tax=uncultured Thiotrichaceae bacterium TaxID=298394 RepID=A0A6S6S1I8_9GAMM|nr:MAG: Acetyl-CoA synthetase (ADP-forming) alpha and beta chains, putative [uncultured Thiotrichaceae bacterium]